MRVREVLMRRILMVLAGLLLCALPSLAQSPEVDALSELALAVDVTTAMRHLPVPLQDALAQLPPSAREEAGKEYLAVERMRQEGATITRVDSGDVLARLDWNDGRRQVEIVLLKRLSDGADCVLRLEARETTASGSPDTASGSTPKKSQRFDVWLRLDEGEWRIVSILSLSDGVNFEDPDRIEKIRAHRQHGN